MKQYISTNFKSLLALFMGFSTMMVACNQDESLPITNDLRVLKVNVNGNRAESGLTDQSVLTSVELVMSHAVIPSDFENALTITPSIDLDVSFDESISIVTFAPLDRFEYDTEYTITLPKGSYGANGEATTEDFSYTLATSSFLAPAITLQASNRSFFEGETVTITASIANVIFDDVTFDLVFGGTAQSGGVDFSSSATSVTIPAGSTSSTFDITASIGDDTEGEETITIALANVVNGAPDSSIKLNLILGDTPPKLELKGVMELDNYIDGAGGRVRAIHLSVLEDIADLSIYHIQIASNGAAADPTDIDFAFPAQPASAGDNLFVVRDEDAALAATYFGSCYSDFTEFQTDGMSQNGDDAILLYESGVAIESFGEPGVDGTDTFWEYTDSWAYKIGGVWEYAGVGCVENPTGEATNELSLCKYPFCSPIQLQGVSALLWDGSGVNGGKFIHVRVNRPIADLSQYSLGVANNGGGTDGIEYTFPAIAAAEGDHILVAREPETIGGYLGVCYNDFAQVYQADFNQQNGDDAVELFDGSTVIETYGDADVDGTGESWEYSGSWAYKVGKWTNGALDCAAAATSNQSSDCPYAFCN